MENMYLNKNREIDLLFNLQNLRAEENDLLGRKPEEKEVLKKKEIKKEDLDIKKSLKNDVFFRENNLLHHFYISYYT